VEILPADDTIAAYAQQSAIKEILDATIGDSQTREMQLHLKAKELLEAGKVEEAWMVLLANY